MAESSVPCPVLDAIGIVSSDLDRSIDFFALLGIHFPASAGQDHVEATLPNGIRVMLDSEALVTRLNPHWVRSSLDSQATGLAFDCGTPSHVDSLFLVVTQAGFLGATQPWDAFWGQRYAQVCDQDGNKYDLFADLAQ
ncbi:MAG: hypothetical protein OR995_07540 [Candidatus Nanopelagicales bacterium]|nr:hypothetical protein [Candidatus Nanopelagicales bacterium]